MERKKYFLAVLLLLISTLAIGQTNKALIYKAYISNNMTQWRTVVDKMQNIKNPSLAFQFELLNFQYGYIAWCIGNNKNEDAEQYLEKAWDNADFLERNKYKLSSIYAYKSAFYGYEIGLNNITAPYYGPKSKSYTIKSIKTDPSDPLGFQQYANIEYYMPAAFGGSKTLAIEYYKKAIYKTELKGNLSQNWNYLSLLATLAQALEAIGKNDEAKIIYQKALRIEPDFLWVKNELLPNLIKKIKK